MEKERNEDLTTEEQLFEETREEKPYAPRPKWQMVLAWVCLVLFVAMIAMYMFNIARGGL